MLAEHTSLPVIEPDLYKVPVVAPMSRHAARQLFKALGARLARQLVLSCKDYCGRDELKLWDYIEHYFDENDVEIGSHCNILDNVRFMSRRWDASFFNSMSITCSWHDRTQDVPQPIGSADE
jgi:hypothetical protein